VTDAQLLEYLIKEYRKIKDMLEYGNIHEYEAEIRLNIIADIIEKVSGNSLDDYDEESIYD
jgi:Mg2+/Co2+ transporter CorC